MNRLFYKLLCLTCLFASCREDRVAKAYAEKSYALKTAFQAQNLNFPSQILIQVFKMENELDVWVKDTTKYKLFKTYKICKISGVSGRKMKEGDKQVPEGFYFIEKFNRFTNTFPHCLPFWQSLKLGYDPFDKSHIWLAPNMVNGTYLFP